MDSILLNNRPLLRCEAEYGVIVCLTCNNAFPKKPIIHHLRHSHHILANLYRSILESFRHETLAENWSNLSSRRFIDESAPIEGLKIRLGYACMRCGFRTTSDHVIKGHSKCRRRVRRADLQCWNPSDDDVYWIMITPSSSSPSATTTIDIAIAANDSLFSQADIFFPTDLS